ncbi:helix-turn-helix transcriptional regulator [Flavobacterium sp. FlaQc-48]|uniref:helix-turn-helix transcriptional regulator n=1 Tax=Flavobacterium sp. FlaQc-48 TaxID=3374181 RepID=UPI0037576C8F
MNIVVANKIKALRKNKNMSQEEMADYLEISQSAYARMETGESHSWAIHILKICKIFEITPDELLRTDYKKSKPNQKQMKTTAVLIELSDKVIQQYEERIKELKKVIKDLKKERKA